MGAKPKSMGECLDDLGKENADLRAALQEVALALVETSNTLESVDPNAPSLEMANLVIGKHIRIVAPLIEEARNRKEG